MTRQMTPRHEIGAKPLASRRHTGGIAGPGYAVAI